LSKPGPGGAAPGSEDAVKIAVAQTAAGHHERIHAWGPRVRES